MFLFWNKTAPLDSRKSSSARKQRRHSFKKNGESCDSPFLFSAFIARSIHSRHGKIPNDRYDCAIFSIELTNAAVRMSFTLGLPKYCSITVW